MGKLRKKGVHVENALRARSEFDSGSSTELEFATESNAKSTLFVSTKVVISEETRRVWDMERGPNEVQHAVLTEDQALAEKIFVEGLQIREGKAVVPILWRPQEPQFQNNYHAALK